MVGGDGGGVKVVEPEGEAARRRRDSGPGAARCGESPATVDDRGVEK